LLHNKGVFLSNLGKDEEAIKWLDKTLKIDPNDFNTLTTKAYSLSNLGEDEGLSSGLTKLSR
jgi:Flp pilus assembly protein TadD